MSVRPSEIPKRRGLDLESRQASHALGWRRETLFLVSVFFAALIIYAPAVYLPFQFDDALFLKDDNVRLGRLEAFLVPPAPRVLSWLTLALQHRWHGFNPADFHAFNVVMHGLNAVLVFVLLMLFLRLRERMVGGGAAPGGGFHPRAGAPFFETHRTWVAWAAFVGALVFALHPIQTEPVYYVYQRSTLLAAFFCFLALIAYTRDRSILASGFFLAAVASKEFAVVLPAVLWFFDWIWRRRLRPGRTVSILALVSVVIVVRAAFFSGGIAGEYALGQVSVFWSYLSLVFLGAPLNLDHQVSNSIDLMNPAWWLGCLSLALLPVLVIVLRKKHPLQAFSCGVFLLFLFPTSSLVPRADPMSEHRLYASMLGWAGIVAGVSLFLMNLGAARKTTMARRSAQIAGLLGIGLLLATYAVGVVERGDVWQDPVALWRDTVSKSAGKYRPNYNLGVLLMGTAPKEAVLYLNRAAAIDPSQPLAYRSLGEIYFRSGDLDSAERTWQLALSLGRRDPEPHIALGRLYLHRKDFIRAREHLLAARELEPLNLDVCYYLALANFQFGFIENAIAECEKGLNIDGTRQRLRVLLADIVAQTGNWPRAIELYRESLQSARESQTCFKLARAYWANGQVSEARSSVREGIQDAKSRQDVRFGFWMRERFFGQD